MIGPTMQDERGGEGKALQVGSEEAAPVAVCIVTYNSARELPGCMQALGSLRPKPIEIVVVDSASSDGSADLARSCAPPGLPVEVRALRENLGFTGAMNLALACSRAPFVLSLNPDARPAPDALGHLMARIAGDRVGAVAARLVRPGDPDFSLLDACGMRLSPAWRHFDRGSNRMDRGQFASACWVFGATGAASLYRREALEDVAIDGRVFPPEFHTFREDAELCFRLQERGWRVAYEPRAAVVHSRQNLPSRRHLMPDSVNFHSLKNRYLLRAYHQTWENLLLTLPASLFRDLAALIYVLLFERTSFSAYAWLWKNRERILERRRKIQGRRTRPRGEINRWFFRSSVPIPGERSVRLKRRPMAEIVARSRAEN